MSRYKIEQNSRTRRWMVYLPNGEKILGSFTDFASARREVDALAGQHFEPVNDGPKDEPHYD